MDNKLESYVKIYNLLDPNKCDESVSELEHLEFKKHQYYDAQKNETVSFEKELNVYQGHSIHNEYYMSQIRESIKKYMLEIRLPWFTSWTGYSAVRYNQYISGSEMKIHCDHIQTLFDGTYRGVPILSVIGCLNDNYKGGKFIMFDDTEIHLEKGDIMLFPSNFLYPHCVTEVTQGTRYSFVSWVF